MTLTDRLAEALRECPFCGSAGMLYGGYASCSGEDCPGTQIRTPAWHWNRRAEYDRERDKGEGEREDGK